jgi:DNA excision repair protein ERCC-4
MDFYLQSKLALLCLTFPRLRIIWSSSPHESVKILSDLKLNHDEPEELLAVMKGQGEGESLRDSVENAAAVEMLRAIPGISGHNLRLVMSKIESIAELVSMKEKVIKEVIGNENGAKAWQFIHKDSRVEETFEGIPIPRRPRPSK